MQRLRADIDRIFYVLEIQGEAGGSEKSQEQHQGTLFDGGKKAKVGEFLLHCQTVMSLMRDEEQNPCDMHDRRKITVTVGRAPVFWALIEDGKVTESSSAVPNALSSALRRRVAYLRRYGYHQNLFIA